MEAKVMWKGKLAFSATGGDSGLTVPLDANAEVGGGGAGLQPMELFALGLAGCTAMDVISILEKKRQVVTSFEVQVDAERAAEHPKVFTAAVIQYFVAGKALDEVAVVRALELSATKYCPAQAMLAQIMPIALHYHLYEDTGDGQRTLVKSGVYVPESRAVA